MYLDLAHISPSPKVQYVVSWASEEPGHWDMREGTSNRTKYRFKKTSTLERHPYAYDKAMSNTIMVSYQFPHSLSPSPHSFANPTLVSHKYDPSLNQTNVLNDSTYRKHIHVPIRRHVCMRLRLAHPFWFQFSHRELYRELCPHAVREKGWGFYIY